MKCVLKSSTSHHVRPSGKKLDKNIKETERITRMIRGGSRINAEQNPKGQKWRQSDAAITGDNG